MKRLHNRLYKAKNFETLAYLKSRTSKSHTKKPSTHVALSPVLKLQLNTVLSGHDMNITCISLTSHKLYIISGSHDHTVRLWELNSSFQCQVLYSCSDSIDKIIISDDDTYIVSIDESSNTVLYNLISRRIIYRHSFTYGRVISIAFTAGNKFLVFSTNEQKLIFYNLHSNRLQRISTSLYESILISLIAFPNSYLITGYKDGTVKLWQISFTSSMKCIMTHIYKTIDLHTVKILKNERMILVGTLQVIICNIFDNKYSRVVNMSEISSGLCSVSSDSYYLVYLGSNSKIKVWNIQEEKEEDEIQGKFEGGLEVSKDNRWIITAEDSQLILWSFYEKDKEFIID